MKKQISPVAGIIALAVAVIVMAYAGYKMFLQPPPNEPVNPSPGMQKMMADMKAMGARMRAEQKQGAQSNPASQNNPLGR